MRGTAGTKPHRADVNREVEAFGSTPGRMALMRKLGSHWAFLSRGGDLVKVALEETNLAAPCRKAWRGGRVKAGRPVGELLRKPGNDGLDGGDGSGTGKEKVSLG